jgi:CHAD domain-containing protein
MPYRILDDESVTQALRRIGEEQLASARASLDKAADDDPAKGVHDCRKRCKKLRGMVRLVRPALGEQYKPINVALRDAARQLAPIRDARARLDSFDDLLAALPEAERDSALMDTVRRGLRADADAAEGAVQQQSERIERAAALLDEAAGRLAVLELAGDARDAIAGGTKKTYKRGRKAMADALERPEPERFHEWRKRAKYTWYHTRLLRDAAPSVLKPLAKRFHDLSDSLGDAHDLVVIVDHLNQDPKRYGGRDALNAVFEAADRLRRRLERQAISLGRRLYSEPPSTFSRRLVGYYDAWYEHGPEIDQREIDELDAAG